MQENIKFKMHSLEVICKCKFLLATYKFHLNSVAVDVNLLAADVSLEILRQIIALSLNQRAFSFGTNDLKKGF
jgi:hypothetical protein